MIDVHSHVLPGIDDGARDWDATLAMLARAAEDGTRAIVATPHYMEGRYVPSATTVEVLAAEARRRAAAAGIPIEIVAGHEVYATAGIPRLVRERQVATIGAGPYVLVEFSYVEVPRWADLLDEELRGAGLRPILAHPERNGGAIADPRRLHRLLERGWLFQIDGNSLLGRWGDRVRDLAERMLRWRWVHLVGSDAHDAVMRTTGLSHARRQVARLAGEAAAEEIFSAWPRLVLEGQDVPAPRPEPPVTETTWGRIRSIFGR